MAMVRPFHRYRGETAFTLPRLIAILAEQLPLIAPAQTKYRVTEIPTARTIRFYTANGIVDKPARHERGQALYGYRHLLQVLAIKYLQSHYLPLVKVRSLVENVGNRELEQMIPDIPAATAVHRSMTREDRRVVERTLRVASPATPAAATAEPPSEIPSPLPDGDTDLWHRLEVSPGIELVVHAAALSGENRERLRGALLRELAALRGWGDGGGKH
jgi:DNA-binding transcriptional MerR regulator